MSPPQSMNNRKTAGGKVTCLRAEKATIQTYVCSPLTAPTRREKLANAALAAAYMAQAEAEFGGRAVAPHAYLPQLLDDSVPQERALALEFDLKLLAMCAQLVVYGPRISQGMQGEIAAAKEMGIPVIYRLSLQGAAGDALSEAS